MDLVEAKAIAVALVAEHGLTGWRVAFDNAKTRAGACRYGSRTISLSRELTALHAAEEVRDTILHEIAHALAGHAHGHDAVWAATAKRIGCSGTRCVSADAPRVDGAWSGTCPAGHTTTAHRCPVRVKSCPECAPKFHPGAIFTWTYYGQSVPMHPNYVAELARIRANAAGESPPPERVRPGQRVRLSGAGPYRGRIAVVEGVRRTRCVVRLEDGARLDAPLGLVEPC